MLDLFDSPKFSALCGIVLACYILRDVACIVDTLVRDALAPTARK